MVCFHGSLFNNGIMMILGYNFSMKFANCVQIVLLMYFLSGCVNYRITVLGDGSPLAGADILVGKRHYKTDRLGHATILKELLQIGEIPVISVDHKLYKKKTYLYDGRNNVVNLNSFSLLSDLSIELVLNRCGFSSDNLLWSDDVSMMVYGKNEAEYLFVRSEKGHVLEYILYQDSAVINYDGFGREQFRDFERDGVLIRRMSNGYEMNFGPMELSGVAKLKAHSQKKKYYFNLHSGGRSYSSGFGRGLAEILVGFARSAK